MPQRARHKEVRMNFVFVSNYINHHQIPFCEAMRARLGDGFHFVQTEPMEEERIRMGWAVDCAKLPYVSVLYGEAEHVRLLEEMIQEADVALFGWTDREDLVQRRLEAGKPVIRESERLYREGQWKALSPRGLLRKYHDHTRWRGADSFLLCNGAYVASDFALIHAYPGKKFRWGYFPELRRYREEDFRRLKGGIWESGGADQTGEGEELRLLWAGRFLPLKHPEFAVHYAAHLRERGIPFHLDMIGAGEMDSRLRDYVREQNLSEQVKFHGFLHPEEVRGFMERAHIYLFTSNHLEGWGAVINEAMNSGCAVVAGSEAGAVPTLLRQAENGLIFCGEDEEDFFRKADWVTEHPERIPALGLAAYRTIAEEWNAECAAERLLGLAEALCGSDPADDRSAEGPDSGERRALRGDWTAPGEGPMSPDPALKPFLKVPELPGE